MKKNPYPGKFIVFEGLDGSGQTTQANLLKNFLVKEKKEVILTKEPTQDSEAGKLIRKILTEEEKISPAKLQQLMVEDRREHLEKLVIPALKENKIVISDRYLFSTLAFGAADNLEFDWLVKLNEDFVLPDITFILKVPPKVCLERIEKRGEKKTLFEKEEKLTKAWQVYQQIPSLFEDVYLINGNQSPEMVHEDVKAIIKSKLSL